MIVRRTRPKWFDERDASRPKRWILAPLAVLSWAYSVLVEVARALRGGPLLPAARLPCQVVSVGNLGVGGSGKTPLVAALALLAQRQGHRCAVASRGYGRRGRGAEVASDGSGPRSSPDAIGDEPACLARQLHGVPVLVGRDRVRTGRLALTRFGTELLLLDDGFQHFRLARDLDLVAVDGAAGFGNGAVLPRGPLREPLCALRFADAVIVVDGPLDLRDAAYLDRWAPLAPRFAARRSPVALRRVGSGGRIGCKAPATLAGQAVGMLCGIARPESFRETLRGLGVELRAERIFPDHHRYTARDLRDLVTPPRCWLVTEKDAVKLDPIVAVDPMSEGEAVEFWALTIELRFEAEAEFAAWLDGALRRAARQGR